MTIDVIDLRSFYSSALGNVARRVIHKILRQRFANCTGYSILGIGYATPYLEMFRQEAVRVLAFMPAEQGVVNWPASGLSSSALIETSALPLPNSCIDRALIIHALEITEHPRELLAEVWRILTPGGRVAIVVPGRSGLWARLDRTPFGHGKPYSRSQLAELLRECLFSPTHWTEALYVPPFQHKTWLHASAFVEDVGVFLSLPGGGVLIVEATKLLYRPVALRNALVYAVPNRAPVLLPETAGAASPRRLWQPLRRPASSWQADGSSLPQAEAFG
ncbi:MAG TPA: methyltransferase domain-containing protein [Methylocella sp.]|nr:methyltransferase domain-containing protein [Methylocella sp.]